MDWLLAVALPLQLIPALIISALLYKLRWRGRPDRNGERAVGFWVACAAGHAMYRIAYPDASQLTGWLLFALPPLLVGFGLMAVRIRRNPEALFAPETIARWRRHRPGT